MPYTFTYNDVYIDTPFGTGGSVTFTTGTTPSGGPYTVTGASGPFDGSTVTGVLPGSTLGVGTGFVDGLNASGVTFLLSNGETDTFYLGADGVTLYDRVVQLNVVHVSPITSVNYSTTACFLRGTMILAEGGERPIESVQIGDMLVTGGGALRPVKWVGRRSYTGRLASGTKVLQPVRIRAGALGSGLPHRDLLVSPKHAMLIDGILIAAEDLINGSSIVQEIGLSEIEYIHVEFETHDVVVVEGALSESFVDDENRAIFHNAAEYVALYPNELPREAAYCAPRVSDGHQVEAIRAHLAGEGYRLAA